MSMTNSNRSTGSRVGSCVGCIASSLDRITMLINHILQKKLSRLWCCHGSFMSDDEGRKGSIKQLRGNRDDGIQIRVTYRVVHTECIVYITSE